MLFACLPAAIVTAMISSTAAAAAPTPGAGGIDRGLARRYFDEARRLSDADGGGLWGSPLYGPMLFVEPDSRAVVANEPDAQGRLIADGDVFTGALPEDQMIANTALRWAGKHWTMVMWPLPEDRFDRGRLLMHECFHRIQDGLGLPASSPPNSHLDSRDGRIWLQLEWRALARALAADGDARREAIADALTFRAVRQARFPEGAGEERALELNEGLAEYTGWRLGGLPDPALTDRAAARLHNQENLQNFVRSFAYASGPAYALLLDQAAPDWRKKVKPDLDLAFALGEACKLAPRAPDEDAARARGVRYAGDQLIAVETQRAVRREQRLATYRKRFLEGPVLILPLGDDVHYNFNPNGVEALDESGTVYETIRLVDEWGILDVTGGGALLLRREGRMVEVRVPAPASLAGRPLQGEGWSLKLSEGWTPSSIDGKVVLARP